MDATKFLTEQHDEVRKLFKQYEKARGGARAEKEWLFREIKQKLEIHAQIEEEIFYPSLRKARSKDAREDVLEAYEEHHLIKTVLRDLSSVDPASEEEFDSKVKVLRENVDHHADEEEDELFSDAKKVLAKEKLEELGRRLEARAEELKAYYISEVIR